MKHFALLIGVLFLGVPQVRANTVAYAQCGTYDSYILIYKSTQKFDELGKLRCGEKVEVIAQNDAYTQLQTADGRVGWVLNSDLSTKAQVPQQEFTFGLTEKPVPTPTRSAELPPPQPSQPMVQRRSEPAPLITNVNVMKMQGDRYAADVIIAKIASSRCDFDTSPEGIHRLKLSGISDRIVLAMLHAPEAFPAVSGDATATRNINIPDGTAVDVAVSSDVPSDGLREGSIVEMSVVRDVTLDGVTIFQRGAQARARVMAVRRGGLGSSGEAVWFMQDVQAATGDRIPANFSTTQDDKVSVGNFAGYPFFISEFRKNAPAIAALGDHFTAVVAGNISLRIPQPVRADQVAANRSKPEPPAQPAAAANTAASFPVVVEAPEQQTAVKP
jgi:uncharacterized protein YgiM (DUF1202 family)